MGSRRNELNMHLNERLVKIYENRTFVLLISGLILLTLCIILFVQIVTYKLRIRKFVPRLWHFLASLVIQNDKATNALTVKMQINPCHESDGGFCYMC